MVSDKNPTHTSLSNKRINCLCTGGSSQGPRQLTRTLEEQGPSQDMELNTAGTLSISSWLSYTVRPSLNTVKKMVATSF